MTSDCVKSAFLGLCYLIWKIMRDIPITIGN